jgi:mannose-1-phosphate guanylyltransferase
LFAQSKDPDAIVINCASDHVVTDGEEFSKVMQAASQVAAENPYLVSVGVTPTRPATGFGYIKIGKELQKIDDSLLLYKVDSFREKPDETTAKEFISTGLYFWNANMYVWGSKTLQSAFQKYMPSLAEVTKDIEHLNSQEFHAALPEIYSNAEGISIDYAISEKADNLVLIPGDFGWNDVGDWKVVYDLAEQNLEGNVVLGDNPNHAVTVDSENNLIHTNGRLVALVNIKDMIVIDTEEILMIIPKDSSQDVKKIVEKLKQENRKEYL